MNSVARRLCYDKSVLCKSTISFAIVYSIIHFRDLSRNRLSALHALVFNQLTSLVNLTLARNVLVSLEDGVFLGLNELQRLNIAENHLRAVNSGWLYGMHSLATLYVHRQSSFFCKLFLKSKKSKIEGMQVEKERWWLHFVVYAVN